MEQWLDLLMMFAVLYVLARLLTAWALERLTREIRKDVEEIADRLESGKLVPVTVEVDQDQYFCYNAITKDFVCQGHSLKEIVERFLLRFPQGKLAIYNGDATAVKTLKEQMEKGI